MLRRAPTQARQAGATGTPRTRETFPPASTQAIPAAPAQTFQPTPVLTPVNHTCETMDGVAATAPETSVPGFLGISALLEYGAHTTP